MRGLLALGAMLAACYRPSPASGVPCAANGDCPGAQRCDFGHAPPLCVDMLPVDGARAIDAPADALVAVDAPRPPIRLLHEVTNQAPSASSLSVSLASPPASGDMLVMIGAAISGKLDSVTGGGVTTWTRAAGSYVNCNVELWFGVTDGTSATVTIQRATNTAEIWLSVSEWSGIATVSTLDGALAAAGTSLTASAGTLATTHGHDLLIFAVTAATPNMFGTPTPGTWNAMTGILDTSCAQASWERSVASTSSFSPSVTESGGAWDAVLVGLEGL